jgi:hypothetical protein
MMKRWTWACVFCALALAPLPAQGASPVVAGWGPRIGVSIDPDQLVLGGQLIIGELAPNVTFDPNLELGIGDDVTLIAFNLDGHYHFAIEGSAWRPYAGAGIGINFFSFDAPPGVEDDTETEIGANLMAGAGVPTAAGNRFFAEMRFGLGDIPEIKLIAGWNFRM